MRPSNNLENKTLSGTYWRVQLVCMKVQVRISLEPVRTRRLWWIKVHYDFFIHLRSYRNFRLVVEGKTGREIPKLSRLEFLEKVPANKFALSEAEDSTSGSLNRRGIANLPLLRTLLAIHQKSGESSFWEVMDSFVLIVYASLAASRTLLQRLLACLNLTLNSEDLFCW